MAEGVHFAETRWEQLKVQQHVSTVQKDNQAKRVYDKNLGSLLLFK